MFGFGKKKGPTLGVEINSDSVTLLQLDKSRQGIEVVRFACLPTPANTIREGLIADPQTIGSVIMDLLQQSGVPPSGPSPVMNISIPAQSVVIRLMPVPTGMPPEELAEVVTQEATNHVPFPISDANLDWSLMPATERTDSDGVRRVDVILAAVQRSIIENCWKAADSAGVKLGKVEVSSLSTIRGLALAGYTGSSGFVSMVVNIRQDATDINIVRSAMPLFGRSVIIGVEALTEAISRSLDVDFDQALDLLPEIPLFGMAPQDERMGQAAQVARTVFSDITDELERSLDFYQSQIGDVKLDQIILTGPGCMVPNLDQFVTSRMSHRAVYGDAMRDMTFDQEIIVDRMRPILASLVGSAVEPAWSPSFTVDLDLNKEGRTALLFDERSTQAMEEEPVDGISIRPIVSAGVVSLTLILAIWGYLALYDVPGKTQEITRLNEQITQAKLDLTRVTKLKTDNKLLTERKDVLNFLVKRSRRWSGFLDAIGVNTPQGVQIRNIEFDTTAVKIDGRAANFTDVSNLSLNLSSSPLVEESSVQYATRKEKSPDFISFELSARIRPAITAQGAAPAIVPPLSQNPTRSEPAPLATPAGEPAKKLAGRQGGGEA